MPHESATPHGVMEGKGAYNRYAQLPANGAALAMPLLEEAVSRVTIQHGDRPIVIADYGSSQGQNSLAPMQAAIRKLRVQAGPNRPIMVFHIDQASNDFNSLFQVLSQDAGSYSLDQQKVFPCAIGRSFYEEVLPANSVHLGWSSYAAVWLSRIPGPIPDHFLAPLSTSEVRAQFDRQAAADWSAFLSLRAAELRLGGRLVVVLPAMADDGLTGFEEIMNQANAALAELVEEGAITAEEQSRMVVGAYPRRREDLLAPFAAEGRFQGLRVENCELFPLPDAAWIDYQRDNDAEAFATKHALFFRAVFIPSLASALDRVRAGDAAAADDFANRLQTAIKNRLARHPTAMDSFVEVFVAAKEASL